MALLKEISDQFHLCSALMSDADILRSQSAVVADHFKVTMRKIEELRGYLRRPEVRHNEGYEHWMDESVIDGVKRMVGVVLERHMDPLTTNEFPIVFKKELNFSKMDELYNKLKILRNRALYDYNKASDTDSKGSTDETKAALKEKESDLQAAEKDLEDMKQAINAKAASLLEHNQLIMEIKESNCMGSIILLFYYLYWHLLLIFINEKIYPEFKKVGNDWNINKIIDLLPNERGMLDLRFIFKLTGGLDTLDANNLLTESEYSLHFKNIKCDSRIADLVYTYKTVLYELRGNDKKDAWWVQAGDTAVVCHKTNFRCIEATLKMFNNVISSFNLQDDIQKWTDMYTDFEIKTDINQETEDEALQRRSSMAIYTYRLANILNKEPYQDGSANDSEINYIVNMRRSAIYDYGSTTIMMDISRSLLDINTLLKSLCKPDVEYQTLEKEILIFIYQFRVDGLYLNYTDENYDTFDTNPKAKSIVKPLGSYRRPCRIDDERTFRNELIVENLGGYYLGARSVGMEKFNHRYLAWPGADNPAYQISVLEKIQALIQVLTKDTELVTAELKAAFILQPMQRNSLFVSNISVTLRRFLDRINKSKCFLGKKHIHETRTFPSEQYFKTIFEMYKLNPSSPEWTSAIEGLVSTKRTEIDYEYVSKMLEHEASELDRYISEIKQQKFNKFPCISWPVIYKEGKSDNYKVFKFKEPVISTVQSTQLSTYNLSLYMKEFVEFTKKSSK